MNLTKAELDRTKPVEKVPHKGAKEKNCECIGNERWEGFVYFFSMCCSGEDKKNL